MSSRPVPQSVEGSLSLRNYHLIHELFVLFEANDRQILGRHGLIGSQYRLLMNLDTNPGKRLTELSERLLLSKSTVSRIIDQLEQMKWVRRIEDPDDRRAQRIVLTPLGQKKRIEVSAEHFESLADRFKRIPASEMEELASLLGKMSAGLSSESVDCNDAPRAPGGSGGQAHSKEVRSQTS